MAIHIVFESGVRLLWQFIYLLYHEHAYPLCGLQAGSFAMAIHIVFANGDSCATKPVAAGRGCSLHDDAGVEVVITLVAMLPMTM